MAKPLRHTISVFDDANQTWPAAGDYWANHHLCLLLYVTGERALVS
jgi:hypothetical protein